MTVQELLNRLEGVKRAGGGWVARCPGHEDKHASLSIGRGQDGKVLLNCHAGCAPGDIAAALGIGMAELFPDEPPRRQVVATYDYCDEQGNLLFQVLRLTGKQFRQRKPAGSGWDWKLGDVRRVLYRLPEIVASADEEHLVYLCEGEKDADALARLGLIATSNPGGAGKWRPEYSESLRGREVVILPDNDKPGREHADMVARALEDIALRVRVITLPGLPEKGDVSDWLAKGGTRAELEQMVARAAAWEAGATEPPPASSGGADESEGFVFCTARADGLMPAVRERAASSQPFRVAFLDDLAVGLLETDLVVLGAPTGAGKTTLAAIFAQHASEAGARVHYFALEAHRNEIEMRMLFRIMARLAWQRCVADQQTLEAFTYRRWCHGRCEPVVTHVEADALAELRRKTRSMATFYRSGKFNTDRLVEQMHSVRGESDLIILDHLHFLDDGNDDEIRAMSRTVKAVSDAIQDARTPVIAIAHLRKTDLKSKRVIPHIAEFHGSSDITKVATMVITLAPVDRPRLVHWVADTYMHVAKDRLEGEQNYAAILGFDMRSNSYERGYELGRLQAGGTKWEAVPVGDLPWWAANERRRAG